MADAPSSSSYTLVSPDSVDLPNSRTILADGVGIRLNDTGNAGTLTITTQGNLGHLSSFNTAGYLSYNTTTQNFVGRSFSGGGTISITNPDGVGGNTSLTVIPETTIQLINTQYNTTDPIVTRPTLNFVPGNNVQIDISDNVSNNSADIRLSATGYQPESQNLTDIAALTPLSGSLIVGTGSHYTQLNLGPAGTVLKSDGTTGVWAAVPGTGTVTSVGATSSGTIVITGSPITTSGTLTFNLATTAVTPGVYTNTNLTVDAFGRITAASNGSSGTVTSITAGTNLTGGTITTTGTIALSSTPSGLTSLGVGNLSLTGNTISSTNTNGNINLLPNGSGHVFVTTAGAIALASTAGGNISLQTSSPDGSVLLETEGAGSITLRTIGSGSIGIGTNAPMHPLHFSGVSYFDDTVTYGASAGLVDHVHSLMNYDPYNALPTDSVIVAKSTTASTTITLPASPVTGQTYKIIDGDGNAGTYPIYISGSGNLVNGAQKINFLKNLSTENGPFFAAITPDGNYAYITNYSSSSVSVYKNASTANPIFLKNITVGANPFSIEITPSGNRAYVANSGSTFISVIEDASTTNPIFLKNITVGTNPNYIAITPNGARAYVSNTSSGNISFIENVTIGDPSKTFDITTGGTPSFVAITKSNGDYVYVTDNLNNKISVIKNVSTGSPFKFKEMATGDNPKYIAITPDGNYVYVANFGIASNNVFVIQLASSGDPQPLKNIGVGTNPFAIAITPDGTHAYVVNYGSSNVSVINHASTNGTDFFKNIPVGANPASVAITPDGNYAYVVNNNYESSNVSIINQASIDDADFFKNIPVGAAPASVAITPDGNYAYVTNQQSKNVSLIINASNHSYYINTNYGTTDLVYDGANWSASEQGKSISVCDGGTGVTTLNDHSILIGSGEASVTQLSVGATGTVLAGVTDSDPTFTATPSVTSITITNAPVVGTDGVNKTYADAIAAGLTFKDACIATTTANLTAIYNNGSSGVGATLTNSGALVALVLDGVTIALNARILIKDQATTFQNGIYICTTLGTGIVPWILTRSTDYNVPAEIQPGDLVPIVQGTLYSKSSWLETSTVTAIGTDAILFAPFTYSPVAFLQVLNNLSDLNNTATARTNLGLTNVATQSLTANSVLIGGSSNSIVSQALTNGQVLIGSTGSAPAATTLTAGTNVEITEGGGSITIASGTEGFVDHVNALTHYVYNALSTDSVIVAKSNAANTTISLPISPTTGQTYKIIDGDGNAENHPIYINGNGKLINGMPATLTVIDPIAVQSNPQSVAITPNGNYAYVVNNADKSVSVIQNVSSGTPSLLGDPISVGVSPYYAAITPNGNYVYVPNYDDGNVSVIQGASTDTPSVMIALPVGANPLAIAITPDGNYAYVGNVIDGTVSVFKDASTDTPTEIPTSPLTVGASPYDIAITPDGNYAYVANVIDGTVSVFKDASTDTPTEIPTSPLTVGANPYSIAITPDGNYVYVANKDSDTVSVIKDASTDTPTVLTAPVSVINAPEFVAITPDGNYAYVGSGSSLTVIKNASTLIPTSLTNFSVGASSVVFTPDGKYAYATGNNKVSIIQDASTDLPSVLTTVPVGSQPLYMAITPNGNYVYVPNSTDDTVSIIPTTYTTPNLLTNLTIGAYPRDVAITHDGRYAYVINDGSTNVSVIQNASSNNPIFIKHIAIPSSAHTYIAITPDGNYAYIANNEDNSITIIRNASTSSSYILMTSDFETNSPKFIAITPDGNRAYVANQANSTVSIITNASTNSPSFAARPSVGSSPNFIAITPSGNRAYVPNYSENTVSVIDDATQSVIYNVPIPIGTGPVAIAITPDGTRAYVININNEIGSGTVSVIENATTGVPSVFHTIVDDIGARPSGIAITPDGQYVYVANTYDDTVSLILNSLTDDPSVIKTISDVSVEPSIVKITPDGNYVYVNNGLGSKLTIIQDASTVDPSILTKNIPTESNIYNITITPDGNYVYVSNYSGNTVSVIQNASTESEKINTNYGSDVLVYNGTQWLTY